MKKVATLAVVVAFLSVTAMVARAEAPKAALGVTMNDNTVPGVLITRVVPNSPASRIGLQAGDRILAVNNQPTANYQDVARIIGASRANATIELTVARGVWQGKLTAQLGSSDVVFNPAQQAAPAQQFLPTSRPAYVMPANPSGWNAQPFDFYDNGSRGASASYGGGGY